MKGLAIVALSEVFEPLVKQMEKRIAAHCTRSLSDIDEIVQTARIKFASAVERDVHGSFTNGCASDPKPYKRFAWICLKQSQIDFGRRQKFRSRKIHEDDQVRQNEPIVCETDWTPELIEALQQLLPSIPAKDVRIIECIRQCRIERDAANELGMTPVQLTREKQRIVAEIRALLLSTGDYHAI